MSFALKPINRRIQRALERKSKIFSRDTSALSTKSGTSNELNRVQGRTTWIRWISGNENPIVILGGVAHFDESMTYSLAEGFDQVYIPPNTSIKYNKRREGSEGRVAGKYFKPLAGVKSITSTFGGAQKALRDVVVNWTVFDLDELEILTPHFLSPGKWTMLEMGWNYEGRKFKNDRLLGSKLLKDDLDFAEFESMEEIIYEKDGDYEVLTGIIKNFSYSVRDDGGFDCTTTFGTHGTSLLDAGKDTTNYTIDKTLSVVKLTDSSKSQIVRVDDTVDTVDKETQTTRLTDNLNTTINRLASYFRFQCVKNKAYTGKGGKVSKNDIVKGMFIGQHGKTPFNFYGEPKNWFLCAKEWNVEETIEEGNYIGLDKDCETWVRWGWFEDNVLNKYMGYATFERSSEEATLGKVTGIKDIKLQFRSIESKLVTDDSGTIGQKVKIGNTKKYEKESVRILSHPKLLTTDINKFIFVGRTHTLARAADIPHELGASVGKFLDANIGDGAKDLKKFVVAESVNSTTGFEEGYLRNIYFNTKWLVEQIKGVLTLREALDNILNGLNTEYQNYWDFDIVGDASDITTAKIVDKNNSRYSVDNFSLSDINLTTDNPTDSTYSCYQFPTWTKDSIVSNMDYSVTIPSSMVAVAALSGGGLDTEDPAHRGKGDVDVQQFVKSMRKAFKDNKDRFFENIGRITDYVDVAAIGKFGRKDADPNKLLKANEGVNIIMEVVNRDKELANPVAAVGGVVIPEFGGAEQVMLKNEHPYFSSGYTQPDADMLQNSNFRKLYSKTGVMYQDGKFGNDYIRTMMGRLHSNRRTAKTKLADLLNGIAELKLTIDGTAGIFPGDAFTSHHLPNKLVNRDANGKFPLIFQTTNVEHELGPDGWKTTITGQPRINSKKLYSPTPVGDFRITPGGGVVSDTDFGRKLGRFQQTRNILGINGYYLNKYKMCNGLIRVSKMDPYWKDMGEKDETNTYDIPDDKHPTGRFSGRWPLSISIPYSKNTPVHELSWMSFTTFTLLGTLHTKTNLEIHPGSLPMAIFHENISVQKAMWYSMYNAILYAMPPERSCYKTIDPYISMDASFRLASYFLFVSDDITGDEIQRWEKGTADDGKKKQKKNAITYTSSFVNKIKREMGATDAWSPVAFLRTTELPLMAGQPNPYLQELWEFRRIAPTKTQYNPPGYQIKPDMDMTVQIKLTKRGKREYKDFFTTMYKNWIQDEFESKISLNNNLQDISREQIDIINKRDTEERERIVGAYADIFKAEGSFFKDEDPTDITTFDPLKEIDNFLTMMVKDGFIFSPLLISKLCGNQDVVGVNTGSQFMDWIRELVGKEGHAWKPDDGGDCPTDTIQKELKHTQSEGFLGIGADD